MRRPPASLRHITAHRTAFAAVAVTVLFITVCAAAAASFASTVTGIAVRRSLTSDPGNSILVTTQTSAADAGRTGAIITTAIRPASSGLPLAFSASLQSQYLNLTQGAPAGLRAQAQIVSLPELARHAALVSGTWPDGRGPGPVPVCVPVPAARRLHLAAGQTRTLRDSASGRVVTIRVTCTFRRTEPASPYWSLSPVGPSGVQQSGGFIVYGPLVTSPPSLAASGVPVISGAWLGVPDFSRLRAANLARLSSQLAAASSGLAASLSGTDVSTRLPAELNTLATSLVVARSQLVIGLLILLVSAGAALVLTVRMLTLQRGAEAALLAARGASRRQLAARGITDALLLAIPAFLVGPLIGGWLVTRLTSLRPLARVGLRLTPGQPASAWLAAGAVAAGCAVIIALPSLRPPPSPLQQRSERGRQRAIAAAASAGADLALVALAVGAGWQLAHYSGPVTFGVSGTIGIDPILVSAPVLALAAGTLLILRLLPLVTRLADAAAARGRGITVPVAAWQISRRPLRQAGPALLGVLAVATAVVLLAETVSWHHSVQAQARFTVGADARITLPPAAALPVGQVAEITGARGVLASTPVARTTFTVPQGGIATLLAVGARTPASLAAVSDDAGGLAGAALLRRLQPAGQSPGTLIPGRPALLRITARLTGAGAGASEEAGASTGAAAPELAVGLTDAAGVSYLVPVGTLPADGRGHRLTAAIAAGRHADYPLRLTGFSLQYLQADRPSGAAALRIESVRTAAAPASQFSRPFPLTPAAGQPLLTVTGGPGGFAPAKARAQARGSALTVSFLTGAGGSGSAQPAAGASILETAGPAPAALPALATRSFLAASGVQVGGTEFIQIQGTAVRCVIIGQVARFPTVTGSAGGLVVDQAALQDVLRTHGVAPLPVTQWWLTTSGHPVIPGLPPGASAASVTTLARALSAQPLSVAPLQALLAIAVAAALLACGGFVVSVATGRERQRDVALLDALGARSGQVVRLMCLEQALLAVPAAAAGLVLGILLSRLIIPAVSLTAQAVRPDPPVLVQVPWLAAVGVAAIIALVPAVAAALAATRPTAAAARLRAEEET
jgi:FtsX-like permease family protein